MPLFSVKITPAEVCRRQLNNARLSTGPLYNGPSLSLALAWHERLESQQLDFSQTLFLQCFSKVALKRADGRLFIPTSLLSFLTGQEIRSGLPVFWSSQWLAASRKRKCNRWEIARVQAGCVVKDWQNNQTNKKNSDFIEQTAAYRVFQYNTLEVVKLQQTPRINAAHVHWL